MTKKEIIKARVENNLKVLKLLKDNDATISAEEKRAILNEYTGWGGLRDAIYDPYVYRQLKSCLSDNKIISIKETTKSAYYTPELLVKFIWSVLGVSGFKGGEILEPASGIGAFLDHMPEPIRSNSKIDAVEMDLFTSQILTAKYPTLNISCAGFENLNYGNKKYDLIISNPPYSSLVVEDIHHKDLSHLAIHHFFVAKSARLLAKNGIIAMVLPQFFLDNSRDHARAIIAASGVNMVAAYRLPDNLFANAKITVDIVFLHKSVTNIAWQESKNTKIGNYTKPMNEYFINHPDNVLGTLEVIPMYKRMGITCNSKGDLREQFKTIFLKLKQEAINNKNLKFSI
jgi:hypothetical protein